MRTKLALFSLIAFAALGSSGCVAKTEQDDTTVVRFAAWVGISWIAGFVVLLIFGWLIRKSLKTFLTATGVLLALGIFFLPDFFLTHVTVTADGFESRGGYWLLPERHTVRFDDVTAIRFVRRRDDLMELAC